MNGREINAEDHYPEHDGEYTDYPGDDFSFELD